MVIFDRFMTEEQFGWRVAETTPEALRILNTEDLHSLRRTREVNFNTETKNSLSAWSNSDLAMRELASILRSDLSLIISKYEYDLLVKNARIPESYLLYLPFFGKGESLLENHPGAAFESRSGFIFVGNGKHAPNVDAVHWLHAEIWPEIRKALPQSELRIYGAYLPEAVLKLHDPAVGFRVEGWIEDSGNAVGGARVNLAPLRFGAGMKGKIVEAMRCGTPSMATGIGWEGLADNNEIDSCIADSASDFAQKAIALYENKGFWQIQHDFQTRIYKKLFSWSEHTERLRNSIDNLREDLSLHREQNIIGNILRHQSMASTKYMSRWIEAKNKPNQAG